MKTIQYPWYATTDFYSKINVLIDSLSESIVRWEREDKSITEPCSKDTALNLAIVLIPLPTKTHAYAYIHTRFVTRRNKAKENGIRARL